MLAKLRTMKQDEGFTLVELLVVIAILGILAGIVVFSVAGITDTGKVSACATEKSELTTAEEAYFAGSASSGLGGGKYAATNAILVTAKLLQSAPTLYQVTSASPYSSYSVGPIASNPDNCT